MQAVCLLQVLLQAKNEPVKLKTYMVKVSKYSLVSRYGNYDNQKWNVI